MKKLMYFLMIIFLFITNLYSQNFSDIVNLDYNNRAKNVIKGSTNQLLRTLTPPDTIKEIVIISTDSGTGGDLSPYPWFDQLFSAHLPQYFKRRQLLTIIFISRLL